MKKDLNFSKRDSRRFERRPDGRTIECSLDSIDVKDLKKLEVRADIIDISEEGICIETDYPLEPGHKLWFNGGIERGGVVKWCVKLNNIFKVGIKLVESGDYIKFLDEANDDILYISETKEKYTRLLNDETDKFIKNLENYEKRCFDPKGNSDELLNEVTIILTEMSYVCEEFEKGVNCDKSVIKDAQIRFREKTNPILSKSYFINRTRIWPQGYPGDHKTLEVIYRNIPLSEGIGYYLDLYCLNVTLAHAIRNRIKKLEEMLRDEILKREKPSILNIACGSCRELMGLSEEIKKSQAKIICVDNDGDAIAFAQNRLSYAGVTSQAELYKYNAHRMFDHEMNMVEFGMQDIIYSVGYFDYLPDEFLVKTLKALYMLLNRGGKLIAAFKDADLYRTQDYFWLVDWYGFLQRTEEDFDRLLYQAEIPKSALSMTRDKSGVIIFYTAIKR